jgi:predicted site-specific integrase-resolvase
VEQELAKLSRPLNTADAAKALGVSKVTLLRWIRAGKTADVGRDRHGWRVFTSADIQRIKKDLGIAA